MKETFYSTGQEDHRGNVRVSFSKDINGDATVVQ